MANWRDIFAGIFRLPVAGARIGRGNLPKDYYLIGTPQHHAGRGLDWLRQRPRKKALVFSVDLEQIRSSAVALMRGPVIHVAGTRDLPLVPISEVPMATLARPAILLLLAVALSCATARAARADTSIVFNNASHGYVTTQYQSEGVVFAVGPGGAGFQPYQIQTPTLGPVLSITTLSGDFPSTELWGQFPKTPSQNLSFAVGDYGSTSHALELDAVDASGNVVVTAQVTTQGGAAPVTLSVHSVAANITFFHLFVPPSAYTDPFARNFVASMTFDSPTTAPDFALIVGVLPQSTIVLSPGDAYPVQLTLERLSGSSGPIAIAVDGLPPGVTAALSPPSPESGASGSGIAMQLGAPPGTAAGSGVMTIVATPSSASAGIVPHSYDVPINVLGIDTPQVQGIEVTQGIQCAGFNAQADPPCQTALGVSARSGYGTTATYNGVPLAPNILTVARVFADVKGAPAGGIAGFSALLHGFDGSGREFTGSPLLPVFSPAVLIDSQSPSVVAPEQLSTSAAFEFVLPWSWTQSGPISLKAELLAPVPSFSQAPAATWCSDPTTCVPLNALTLANVNFVQFAEPGEGLILPLSVTWGFTPPNPLPPPVPAVLANAAKLTPDAIFSFPNYIASLDISWIANQCPGVFGNACSSRSSRSSHVLDKLNHWYKQQSSLPTPNWLQFYSLVLGVEAGSLPNGENDLGMESSSENSTIAIAVVDSTRPLTSVAHEIGHALGRVHASPCQTPTSGPVGTYETWPPDQQGFIQGIGLDVGTPPPFTINAPGLGSEPKQWFDFMGYCANPNDTDLWISVKGWNEVISHLGQLNGIASASSAMASAPSGCPSPALWVTASLAEDGDVDLLSVGTYSYAAQPDGSASPYTLVVRDGSGNVIGTTSMMEAMFHIDHEAAMGVRLEAAMAAADAASIEIVRDGRVLAARSRSTVPLTLRVTRVVANKDDGGVNVAWTMTTRDGPGISVDVDYSADGGTTWQTVFSGYDRTGVTLPGSVLAASASGRVRVRANDGFSDASAVSETFAESGAPPYAVITQPRPDASIQSDVSLPISGFAFDDRHIPLTGASLQWFAVSPGAAPSLLGSGGRMTVADLRPGVEALELVATDRAGRQGTARIPVTVTSGLRFLELGVPTTLPADVNILSFRVRASQPGVLTVRTPDQDASAARIFPVDRTTRIVSVPVAAGAAPIQLRLTLVADGTEVERPITILRLP